MNTKTPQEILLEFDQEPNNEYKNIFLKSTVIKAMEAYHAQFEQVEQKEDINPETGESYFDGINGDKLTRHLPPEQKEGEGEDQDELWVEFMSDYEWYFIDKLKSKYHLTKKQP